ncbi:MAG TPA: hypothetical protein VIK70_00485, partial [Lysobacter sp.]
GIKPGSKAFHDLKRGTVATYDRWGYPVVIDRNVRVDWSKHGPGHGKSMDHAVKPGKGAHAVSHAHPAAKGKAQAVNGKAKVKAKSGGAKAAAKGKGKGNGNGKG